MRTHRDRASSRPRFFFFRTVILADHCARKGPNQADWTLFTGENWTLSDRRQQTAAQRGTLLRDARSIIGLILIIVAILVLNKGKAFPGGWALLPTIGAFLIISAGPEGLVNRTILSNAVMVWFGLISYPLYLWHWPRGCPARS